MTDVSRNIPAEIKRQVLIEAGHCCAIPTCQFYATEFAHIEPFNTVKEHKVDNIIALCPNHHDMYDNKKLIDRKSIMIYKQKLQFLHKRYTKYELRVLAILAEKPVVAVGGEIQVLGLLKDNLIKNAKTFATLNLKMHNKQGNVVFEDEAIQTFAAVLTDKGKQFINNWKSVDEDLETTL